MGLYISKMDTVTIRGQRNFYIYLLDYGWQDSEWEQRFKKHFMKMGDLASETNSVVVASPRGVHFANEVLSWHKFGDIDAKKLLPGILITQTHPNYFQTEQANEDWPPPHEPDPAGMENLLMVPLSQFPDDEAYFIRTIEELFEDIKAGTALEGLRIADNDFRQASQKKLSRFVDSIEIKPGMFGLRFDLRKFARR